MKTGIYKIINIITNDFYIGSASLSIKTRWKCHICELKKNKHRNIHLQRAWNKYGEESFIFEIIEYCEPEKCIKREQHYMDTLNPQYNICKEASSRKGTKQPREAVEKLRLLNKGRPAWNKGIPFSKEVRKKMSRARKGKIPWNKGLSYPRNKPIERHDGKTYKTIREAAKDLNVKENTIIKACTDKKIIRRVRGFVLKYI